MDVGFNKINEEFKVQMTQVMQNISLEKQRLDKAENEQRILDDKISRLAKNLNQTREIFLDLKGQFFTDISNTKQTLSQQIQKVSQRILETRNSQQTCASQIENHRAIIDNLDTVMEKIDLEIFHEIRNIKS